MKEFFKSTVLFVITMSVLLVGAELVLRQTSIASFSLNRGFLFATPPSLVSTSNQAVKYQSNVDIREVAVFGDHIEYDITSRTNDFGFYDTVSYAQAPAGKTGVAFLGDSFTAGSGGNKPWVSTLRESANRSDLNLYSLGVSGTGLLHFEKLLEHANQALSLDVVNIMLITDDFFRPLWFPHSTTEGMFFCHPDTETDRCIKADPKMFRIRLDETRQEIIERTKEKYDFRDIDKDSNRVFHQRLRLFNLFCHTAFTVTQSLESLQSIAKTCPQLRLYHTLRYKRGELYKISADVLARLPANFPNLKFRVFHMPQKSEVYGGEYSLDIQTVVQEAGLEYIPLLEVCQWSLPMFHINDGHPNDIGYSKISECMKDYLPEPDS